MSFSFSKNSNVFRFSFTKNLMPCYSMEDQLFSDKFWFQSHYFFKDKHTIFLSRSKAHSLETKETKLVFNCV